MRLEFSVRSLIGLLPLTIFLAACDRQSGEAGQEQPSQNVAAPTAPAAGGAVEAPAKIDLSQAGTLAPDAPFEDMKGGAVTLADFKGKPLMVNLWATWCAPCVAEMPSLDSLAAKNTDRFRLIAISQDMAGKRAVEPYFAKAGLKALPSYLDKENALMLALKSETLPMTIFYGADGRERWRVVGALDWQGPKAAELIAQGLAK
jgi:thiol-disulfide isomerase/thioredoxin